MTLGQAPHAALEAHGFGKRYRRRTWALRGVDPSVPEGSITAESRRSPWEMASEAQPASCRMRRTGYGRPAPSSGSRSNVAKPIAS